MTSSDFTRRGALAAGASVALAGRADGSPAGTAIPRILSATGSAARSPGFPIGYLGLTWSRGEANIRFRSSAGWGSWRPLPHGDSSTGRRVALLPAGGAESFELDAAPVDLRVIAINATDGPVLRRVDSIGNYRNRAAWGADESLRFGPNGQELFPQAYFPVQTLTVHHTVTPNNDPDPAATVRAIYFFHTVTQSFGDVGYHLLIDSAGVVYEGRYSGADTTPVFGARSASGQPQMCNAAHVGGFNAGNVGVALLGDLTSTQPTAAARGSLVRVLAMLAKETKLNPLGQTNYVNPISGATRTVSTIAAHRDWAATECPGDTFYPTLPALRREVAKAL